METPGLGETVQLASVITNSVGEMGKIGIDSVNLLFRGIGGITKGAYALLTLAMRLNEKNLKDPTRFRKGDYGMTKLLQLCNTKNVNPQIMRISNDSNTVKMFEKYARQNKLAYAIIPDLNTQDDYIEIMYPSTQQLQYTTFMNNANRQRAFSITFEDYLKNATPDKQQEMQKIIDNLSTEEKELIRKSEEKLQEGEPVVEKNVEKNVQKTAEVEDEIVLSKDTIERETSSQYVISVPNTKDKFVAIDKRNCEDYGNTFSFVINPAERYQLLDTNMNFIGEISGKNLYDDYFSKIQNNKVMTMLPDEDVTQDIIIEVSPEMITDNVGDAKVTISSSAGDVTFDKSNLLSIHNNNNELHKFLKLQITDKIKTQSGEITAREFANIVRSDRLKYTRQHNMPKKHKEIINNIVNRKKESR